MAKSRLRREPFLSWPCYDTLLEIWFINACVFLLFSPRFAPALPTQFVSILMKRFIGRAHARTCTTVCTAQKKGKEKKDGETLAAEARREREARKKSHTQTQSMCVANLFDSCDFLKRQNAPTKICVCVWCRTFFYRTLQSLFETLEHKSQLHWIRT